MDAKVRMDDDSFYRMIFQSVKADFVALIVARDDV